MADYIIYADSACDLSPEKLAELGVKYESLTFAFEGEEHEYKNGELAAPDFYARMRAGEIAKTSQIAVGTFRDTFRAELEAGNDILYLGFSSGLSGTYNSARLAMDELRSDFPTRKMIAVDSLCASAGFGLLVYLTVKKRDEGYSIEEAAEYASDLRLSVCHWFTVDDLVYLKRGGRISPALAFIGGALGIKPVMHVDDTGRLVNVTKARGRKAAIKALADKYTETAVDPKSGTVFISHGDCAYDAAKLASMIREEHGVGVEIITDVGPVIGAHSGPGTLALFFIGKQR